MGYPPPGYPPFGYYPNMSHPPFGPTAFSYSTSESAPMQNTDTFPTVAVTDRVKARPIPPARSPPTNPTARIVRREQLPGCWNCLETGHYYTACTKPKQRFCHACTYVPCAGLKELEPNQAQYPQDFLTRKIPPMPQKLSATPLA